jgi:deazaflavin-dependent oxidoreductase (nitroreductase family)
MLCGDSRRVACPGQRQVRGLRRQFAVRRSARGYARDDSRPGKRVRHERDARLEREDHRGVPGERGPGGRDFEGAPLVLVHHRGRKSGREYVSPVMYLPHDTEPGIIYVFATKAGAPADPEWYRNLAAAGDGSVERGPGTYRVTVRELTGAERDRIYGVQHRHRIRLLEERVRALVR